MNELEHLAQTISEVSYYIAGVASAVEGGPDYPVICEKLDDARVDAAIMNQHGRYIEVDGLPPVKERAYMRTRADIESLLKAADVDLAEATGITKDDAARIVLMDTTNDLAALRHVADALGITLDELFWKLYKLVDPKES